MSGSYSKRFYITIVVALLAGAIFFLRGPISDIFATKTDDGTDSPKGEFLEQKEARVIKYWVAPMDRNFRSDEPGKSPMGMDLVPVYEEGADNSGAIKIDPAVVQNIGVKTTFATRKDLSRVIRTVGLVGYDETTVTKIQSKVTGWIEKLYINSAGQKITFDTILLELYSPDLVTTQEEFLLALEYREKVIGDKKSASSLYKAAKRRLELFDVPAHQIHELEKSRRVKKTLHIHSPFDGVIIEKNVTEGMYIKPGDTLYQLADLSKVWVLADVFEDEMRHVKKGQKAILKTPAYPEKKFEGVIDHVYPYLNRESRSVKVRFVFDNGAGLLKPEMYSDVVINAGVMENVITVPAEAVIRTGKRNILFVQKGEGLFDQREVMLAYVSNGQAAITSGLGEGEEVVVSSQFLLDAEAQLTGAPTSEPESEEGDFSSMDHSKMSGESMDHSGMDHSKMGDESMDHSGMDHSKMGDESMDHSGMDHSKMDHGSMDHSSSPNADETDFSKL